MIEVEDCDLTREMQQYGIDMVANRDTRLVAAAELQLTTGRPYYTAPIRQINNPGAAYLQRTSAASLPNPSRCKVFRELTDEELRDGLRAAGSPDGPITHSTRKVYVNLFRKRYPRKNVVQPSRCTQIVPLNANPVLPPVGNHLPGHQQLVPIPDLLAELHAVAPPSPPPPLPHPGENQGRPMQLNGRNSPDHFSPPILNLPVAREANGGSTPSRPHPRILPEVGPLFMRPAPSAGTPPQRTASAALVQPPIPPTVDNGTSTSSPDNAASNSAHSGIESNVRCSLAAVHSSERGALRGGEPTSAQMSAQAEQPEATAANGTVNGSAERPSASDLPTRPTQSPPLQQMLSQFHRLSTNGTHIASDVCFVLQNGDTLFASRGFLAVVCPAMLPFLYNSEGE